MLTRRSFLSSAAALPLAAQSPKPNVLFVAIDDLNDWISPLGGHPQARTPNFDRLAKRSVVFTNAHCNAPLCNPSRASLMAGLYPSTTGVYDNNQPWRQAEKLRDAVTLPQHLRAHGYRAMGSGKTYHDAFPDPQSWDEYWPSKNKQKPADPHPDQPMNGMPNPGNFDWGPLDIPDSKMGDSQVVDWTIEQMAKPQSQPLFLACGISKPHLPWHVPSKYFDMHPLDGIAVPEIRKDDLDDVPPIGRKFAGAQGDHAKVTEFGKWKNGVQAYLAAISYCDAQLGRVLDAFEKSPMYANTNLVLWSDHGWHLGEKLHWRKFTLWEESTRNVLMMAGPGVKPARCARTVSLIDLYPTIAEQCGVPKKEGLDGVSLTPLLRNPGAAWDRPALCTYFRGNHALRDERWRYIRYNDGTEELYDHRVDPQEWTNVAAKPEHSAVKERLAKWLPKTDTPDSPHQRAGGGQKKNA